MFCDGWRRRGREVAAAAVLRGDPNRSDSGDEMTAAARDSCFGLASTGRDANDIHTDDDTKQQHTQTVSVDIHKIIS